MALPLLAAATRWDGRAEPGGARPGQARRAGRDGTRRGGAGRSQAGQGRRSQAGRGAAEDAARARRREKSLLSRVALFPCAREEDDEWVIFALTACERPIRFGRRMRWVEATRALP
jgi:hypothetical protein